MRHSSSMIVSLEGMNKAVYRIAFELAQNSRSGLTVRFLSKKLELPQEEIEYLIDVHHKLLYTDLTKIKLPSEGNTAVKRITDGLECHGDVTSVLQKLKQLSTHDFCRLEEQIDVELGSKKAVSEYIIERYYKHPESIMEYVATHEFSEAAQEAFDIIWQSNDGIMPIANIRALHSGSEFEVEQALWELFRGMALFEMFRYDAEDRLVRSAGLLTELRHWRAQQEKSRKNSTPLKAYDESPGFVKNRRLQMTDQLCQLVATIAAKPVRLRGDGELFKEDLRRLSDIISEESTPSLNACLWAAEGIGWLVRVDNELCAGEIESLIKIDHIDRHKIVYEWLMNTRDETSSKRLLANLLEHLSPSKWYNTENFIRFAIEKHEEHDPPVLKIQNGVHNYISPGAASNMQTTLGRSLEESLHWLGVIELTSDGMDDFLSITELGWKLLSKEDLDPIRPDYAKANREIIVQPNFDIVVPTQGMDTLLTVPLDQFAIRQSTGQATVYLLSKESFTQALQDGHDGDAFIDFLLRYNREESLPRNVMMTLEDWRGGLRRVTLKTITVLDIDDPLVMADLQHRRKFKKFLSPIDPNQYIQYQNDETELIKLLEKDGFIVDHD